MNEGPSTFRPEEVTFEELRTHAEGRWRLAGPNSGGGRTLYRYRGVLLVVGYGDHSSLPGGAEQVIGVLPDNTPGFPPRMGGGHAAGCSHETHWNRDTWSHATTLLWVQPDSVVLFEAGTQTWLCSLQAFTATDSPERADLLGRMGPAVVDEALQCAERRLGR